MMCAWWLPCHYKQGHPGHLNLDCVLLVAACGGTLAPSPRDLTCLLEVLAVGGKEGAL